MIIDSHTHILPDTFRQDRQKYLDRDSTFRDLFSSPRARSASAGELLEEMAESGVGRSVIAGYGWTDLRTAIEANDYLVESAAASSGRLFALCSVNPLWGRDAISEMRRCANAGAIGVGELHADTQNFLDSDLAALAEFFDAARDLGLPVLMHTSEPVGHSYPGKGTVTPEYSLALARAFPENKFVFAHLGGGLPFYSMMPEVGRDLANVYFDTAAFPLLYRSNVLAASAVAAGNDRVLFASDFPLVSQQRALRKLEKASLDEDMRRAILGTNAENAWGLG